MLTVPSCQEGPILALVLLCTFAACGRPESASDVTVASSAPSGSAADRRDFRETRGAVAFDYSVLSTAKGRDSGEETEGSVVQVTVAHVMLDVYSGRLNPYWQLSPDDLEVLLRRLGKLRESDTQAPAPPALGYRGVKIALGEGSAVGEIRVYGGAVTPTDGSPVLADPDRALEVWLLETGRHAISDTLFSELHRAIRYPPTTG